MNLEELIDPNPHHHELNPVLWDNNRLRPEVRVKLLEIARHFALYLNVPRLYLKDVTLSGSSAGYNYSEYSDIDLHLIADFSSVHCDREVEELFDTKRLLYKRDRNIEISGIPVELYVEDSRRPAVSQGVYSIIQGQWLSMPSAKQPQWDEHEVKHMVSVWHKIFKRAMHTGDLQTCRKAVQLLRTYRRHSLRVGGEFATGNLVYKSLRNDDTVEAITLLIDRLHDQQLSIG